MTKYEEMSHIDWAIDRISHLPADITIGALYTHLKHEKEAIEESITAKEAFTHQWYKYTKRISKRPPCATPGHAQDAP